MFFCFLPMTRLHQALIKISLRVTYQSRHQICSCCVLLLLYIIKAARYRVLEVRAAAAIVCEVPGSLIEQIIQIKQQLALVWALSGPHTTHQTPDGCWQCCRGGGGGGGGTVSRITATCYPLPRGCCPPIPPHPHICCVALLRLHYVPVSCCFSTSTTCWCCLRLACVIGSGSNKNYKEF